jgi:hypothetical protein
VATLGKHDPGLAALVRAYGPARAVARRVQLRAMVAALEGRWFPAVDLRSWVELRQIIGANLASLLVEQQMVGRLGRARA